MTTIVDKSLLHNVIDALPPQELAIVQKMFSAFIVDYQDSHLTPDELFAHNQALLDDDWYD